MTDQHGEDRWKPRVGAVLARPVPDSGAIRQRAQRHRRIGGALVLEQDMDELAGLGSQPRGEHQIAVKVGEGRIDERPGLAVEGVPRNKVSERGGQQLAQQRRSVGGGFECRFEQRIVRASGHDGGGREQVARRCIPRESRGRVSGVSGRRTPLAEIRPNAGHDAHNAWIYLNASVDAVGQPLDGSRRYHLRFAAGAVRRSMRSGRSRCTTSRATWSQTRPRYAIKSGDPRAAGRTARW